MRVLPRVVAGLTLIAGIGGVLPCRAQVGLETPAGGIRDGSENAGSEDAGPVKVRSTPQEGIELTIPVRVPRTGPGIQETQAQRKLATDVRLDATDHRVEEPTDVRYRLAPNGTPAKGGGADDQWRLRYYNDHWWYWGTNNTWSYHRGGRWISYQPTPPRRGYSAAAAPVVAAPAAKNPNLGAKAEFYDREGTANSAAP